MARQFPAPPELRLSEPITSYLMLFGVGFVAGTLNVLAGGGSMLTLPMLIFFGLPATVANGTNRVAILMQNIGAVSGFRRHGLIQWQWVGMAGIPASLGAIVGAWLGTNVGDEVFQRVLAIVILAVALYTILDPFKKLDGGAKIDPDSFPLGKPGLYAAFFLAGIYGGFVQVGVGFIVLATATAAGLELVRGNALKVLVALLFTIPALFMYSRSGLVDWGLGVALGVGMMSGGLLGVRLNVLKGKTWIRGAVTVAVVVLAVRLFMT